MKKIFDFTKEKNFFSSEFSDDFHLIYKNSFEDFSKFLDGCCSKINSDNIFWWISSSASRRELQSPLYKNYCILKLIFFLYKNQRLPSKIILSDPILRSIIFDSIDMSNLDLKIVVKKTSSKNHIKNFLISINFLINKFSQALFIKIKFPKPNKIRKYVLAETFIAPDSNQDRYYPQINTFWNQQSTELVFVPTIINFKIFKIFQFFQSLHLLKSHYFYRELLLSFNEIMKASFYLYQVKKLSFHNVNAFFYNTECNLTPLLEQSLSDETFSSISAEGLLNYFFIKKLKIQGYDLNAYIDWWENTSMDKGVNLAINKFFGKHVSKGYMGFVPNEYAFELSPSVGEIKAGTIPSLIGVVGNIFRHLPQRISKSQLTISAPALRFQHIFEPLSLKRNVTKKKILIILPAYYDQAINIVDLIVSAGVKLANEVVIIKSHPALNMAEHFRKIVHPELKIDNFSPIPLLMEQSYVVITGGSSVAIESIINKIPVINIYPQKLPYLKLIPEDAPEELYSVCDTPEDLVECINKYKKNEKVLYNNKIKAEDYFCEPNSENVSSFFA
tara:strand:+ start:239 stop:1915 length:1677 start_codon:yes stop_codon:yes gene_type:complete